ncbi:MAG: URC4/urg3 family protein [Leptolyngbyaceae cyanobacterium bins.349]|nr:URC4/urg3 family protein [Leptolyngbyaceae cyanobacterium bins.349]
MTTDSFPDAIAYLRSPVAIRERCGYLFDLACADQLPSFRVDLTRLQPTAEYVLQVIRANYPTLEVPFHSRWRHFEVGGMTRLTQFNEQLRHLPPRDRAKAKFDLAIISVLLDAGAGAAWQYAEAATGQVFQRSEGLAVASFQMFMDGLFASDRTSLQVDAIALQSLTLADLANGFQVSATNPLVGLEGRLQLLHQLGTVLTQHPDRFGIHPARPGHLVDYLLQHTHNHQLPAAVVLNAILTGLGDIWPGRLTLNGVNLGDVWSHSALSDRHFPALPGLVPFHKLSQWLTYSLLEPLQELGLTITGFDELTGLPEYRNGGLCIDLGLLQVKEPAILQQPQTVDSDAIVEWRALTVISLDRIAATIRQTLGLTADTLPLVKVLQGGTWTAGRKIAATLRSGGVPPIAIESDGTVF